jgi:hypothetical protein
MKRMVILYIWLLPGVLIGCNPARKAAQQKKELDALGRQYVAEYLKNNPCPQLPLIDLDSLCQQIGYSWNVVKEDGADTANDGVLLSLEEKKYSCTHKPKPKHILVPGPPDTRMIQLLNDSIASLTWQLSFCNGKQTGIKEVYLEQSKWKWNNWGWMFAALVVLCAVIVIILLKKKR